MTIDVNAEVNTLIAQGYSGDEAVAMVLQAMKQVDSKQEPEGNFFTMRTDKQKAEYMRKLRESHTSNVWIPPDLLEAENIANSTNENGLTAEQQFKANMAAKNRGSMLTDSKKAEAFFQAFRK